MGSLALIALLLMDADEPVQRIPQCDLRPAQAERLADFHEIQLGWRLLSSGVLIELWGGDAGSWTLLETTPTGISCILRVGEGVPSHKT